MTGILPWVNDRWPLDTSRDFVKFAKTTDIAHPEKRRLY
jgi:hypothetical protein